jgi:hypothetical protein
MSYLIQAGWKKYSIKKSPLLFEREGFRRDDSE